MDDVPERRKIEAILYTTGKFMTMQEIADACGIGSVGHVKEELAVLQKEYHEKSGSLEIQEYEGRYKLNIKKEFGFLASKLVGEGEMDAPTTKTLAVIAYKSPVMQSEIIHIRGNKAYDHIRQLKEDALVTSVKNGRTRTLKLTPKFFEYFDISEQDVKDAFAGVEDHVKKVTPLKMGTTAEKIDELEQQLQNQQSATPESEDAESVEEEQ